VSDRDFAIALGRHLKAFRLKAGLSQEQVGVSLGFKPPHAQSYISRLETGRLLHVTLRTIVGYVQACGVSVPVLGKLLDEMELPPLKPSGRLKKTALGEADNVPERTPIPDQPDRDEGTPVRRTQGRLRTPEPDRDEGSRRTPETKDAIPIPPLVEEREAVKPLSAPVAPLAKKRRETPPKLIEYNVQASAVINAIKVLLRPIDVPYIYRRAYADLGLKVLRVVRKTEQPEWAEKLNVVCQEAERQGLTPELIEKVALRAASTYLQVQRQGPGVVSQAKKVAPYKLKDLFADKYRVYHFRTELRAAVKAALQAMPAPPQQILRGYDWTVTDQFLNRWKRVALSARAAPETLKQMLDTWEQGCIRDGVPPEPARVMRRAIEEKLSGWEE
jgi:transcriptional regulator with XRE-family HTH domain